MVRSVASLVALGSLVFVVTGCSSIRVVKKTPDGGVVALQGDPDGAREKAENYMQSQCASGYDIVEEGEAVVGSETETRRNRGGIFGPTVTSSSTDRSEWRITFKCRGENAGAPRSVIIRF